MVKFEILRVNIFQEACCSARKRLVTLSSIKASIPAYKIYNTNKNKQKSDFTVLNKKIKNGKIYYF